MIYNIISPKNKDDFDKYYYFRWEYLRKPLGKVLDTEKDKIEELSIHRMVVNNQDIILAIGRLHHNSLIESQIRYFAVNKDYRRNGVGSCLMKDLENIAMNNNQKIMLLNSRENAIDFYKSLGYKIIKKTNLLFGKIQHYEMKKVL
jgi:predicted GNAT family N-acyltransferase